MSDPGQKALDLSSKQRALLEALLEERRLGSNAGQAIPRRREREAPPLSFAQERIWFLDQLEPRSAYTASSAVRLGGPLDVTALRASLQEIVRRHAALRTTFVVERGEPVQKIAPQRSVSLPLVDLSPLPEREREVEKRRRAEEESRLPIDLARGPLLRAKLLRLRAQEHELLLTMHHIVYDGWSVGVLIRELGALYDAFRAGRASPLTELPIQYADFACWQRERLQGKVLDTQLSYWKRQLDGVRRLQLSTDRPRPAVQTFTGAYRFRTLSAPLTEGLKRLCQHEGVTLFMTLLAGFQALLHHYTGQDDIVVGSPIANRNRREIEGLIGFFVNSLPMRGDLSGNPRFRELLGRVKETALGAYAHQDLPFEKLVEELRPERDLAQNPVFQVMFAMQNAPAEPLELKELTISAVPIEVEGGRGFDLELHFLEHANRLRAAVLYNTELFEAPTIERMLGNFEVLLEGIVSRPEARLSSLPLLSESEERRLLSEWNATAVEYPSPQTIVDLFAEQTARTPEAVSVVGGGESLSYAELDRRSNRVARHLRAHGVGPEVLVGVCLERSLELVVGLLGILKAGGAYLPLDPEYPKERLRLMLEDASVPVLLSLQSLLGVLPEHGAQVVCLDRDAEALAAHSDAPLESVVDLENLAYVIYTSGSTGRPKGVQVPHGGLVNLASWHVRAYAVAPGDSATLIASIAFDASAWEIWPYLIAGASLHVPDEETRLLPRRLATWLTERAITHCFIMTPLAESLLAEPGLEGLGLRYLLTGGDKLHRNAVQTLPCPVVNHYGPTEFSVVTTAGVVSAGATADPPIGRPISNTRLYVLDPAGRPVPQGVAGELFIAGAGLARGYLKRPDLTAARFVPDPFSREPGGRLYRTGDLVRYRADGSLDFLGRKDHQVKLRGYRIELGEIEAALATLPELANGVVELREDRPGDKRLVAYVVPRPESGPAPNGAEIREKLRRELPDFMVPGTVVPLDALPLTANGKIDRRALPRTEASNLDDDALVPPRDDTEERLARIWGEVLGLSQVGIHQNFFDLGGHSLLLPKVHARVEEAFPARELALVDLFEHATVASLAEHLRGARSSPTPTPDRAERLQGRERLGRRLEMRRRAAQEASR